MIVPPNAPFTVRLKFFAESRPVMVPRKEAALFNTRNLFADLAVVPPSTWSVVVASPARTASMVSARQSGASLQPYSILNVELAFSEIAPSRMKCDTSCAMPMAPLPSMIMFGTVTLRVPPFVSFLRVRYAPPVNVSERPPNVTASVAVGGVRNCFAASTMKSEFAKSEIVASGFVAPCVMDQPTLELALPSNDVVLPGSLPTL